MSSSVSIRLLSTQGDARLLELAQAGHERAFEALVRRYRRPLLAYCRRLLLSEEHAEDALQQALLQAWLALRSGTEVANAKPWLYTIVHNAALNALRVSGYDYCTLSESLSGADAPQADLDRRIAVREALAGLAALPEMQREALLRTAIEGDSHQQVARDLGIGETAVRGLVYRARATLRTALGAFVPSPLIGWALDSGTGSATLAERLGEAGLGGGSAGVAGLLMKGGAAAVTAGVLVGGAHVVQPHRTITVERSSPPHARPADSQPRPRQNASSVTTAMLRAGGSRSGPTERVQLGRGDRRDREDGRHGRPEPLQGTVLPATKNRDEGRSGQGRGENGDSHEQRHEEDRGAFGRGEGPDTDRGRGEVKQEGGADRRDPGGDATDGSDRDRTSGHGKGDSGQSGGTDDSGGSGQASEGSSGSPPTGSEGGPLDGSDGPGPGGDAREQWLQGNDSGLGSPSVSSRSPSSGSGDGGSSPDSSDVGSSGGKDST